MVYYGIRYLLNDNILLQVILYIKTNMQIIMKKIDISTSSDYLFQISTCGEIFHYDKFIDIYISLLQEKYFIL